ncbi:hypothetical protein PFISCL1PPCAC_20472, partial [Pristionchus fissidentatus]
LTLPPAFSPYSLFSPPSMRSVVMYVMQPFSIDCTGGSGSQYPTPGFVIFRRLDMHDFCEVKDLGNECFSDMHYPDTYWCSLLSDQTDVLCIGCTDGSSGKLLGVITVAPDALSFLPSSQRDGEVSILLDYYRHCAYITTLCVHPAYRKLGFARQLVQKAIEELRSRVQPSTLLFLHVADDNTGAMNFYFRIGFSHYCSIPSYYRVRAERDNKSATACVFALSLCGQQLKSQTCQSTQETPSQRLLSRTQTFIASLRMPTFLSR